MLGTLAHCGGAILRTVPFAERIAFAMLRASDTRPFRSARHRLFRAWASGLTVERAVRTAWLPRAVQLRVDVRDFCGISYIEPRGIEKPTTDHLLANLRPGDVFADVGANVGYMSLQAAKRVGPTGAVWCFEPNPRLIELLRQSVRVNRFDGWVHPFQVALVEADGPDRLLYLSADPGNSGLSSLAPDEAHWHAGRMSEGEPLSVPVATFDTFTGGHGLTRLDAVKIDVEGVESAVIEGMRGSITRFRPRFLIVETRLGSPAAVALEGLGYRSRMLESMSEDGGWGNVLFEPGEHSTGAA